MAHEGFEKEDKLFALIMDEIKIETLNLQSLGVW